MTMQERLVEALARCVATHVGGTRACYAPEYLAARRAYHDLLVEAGAMDRINADIDAMKQAKAARMRKPG